MTRILSTLFFVLLFFSVIAQEGWAEHYNFKDSIRRLYIEVDATEDPRVKVEKLFTIALYQTNLDTALQTIHNAELLIEQLNDPLLQSEVALEKAMLYHALGNYIKSSKIYDSIVPIYEKLVDSETFYKMEFQHSKFLFDGGRYYDALETGLEAYDYFSKKPGQETYSGLLSNVIASIYKKLGRNEEAILQYKKSIEWCKKTEHANCISTSFHNICDLYLKLNQPELAEKAVFNAEQTIKNHPELKWKLMYTNLKKAKIYVATKKPQQAIEIITNNFENVIANGFPVDEGWHYFHLGQAHLLKNDNHNALKSNKKALDIGNEIDSKSLKLSAHHANSIIFENLGRPSNALESMRNYHAIRESVLSNEKIAQINELDLKYKSAVAKNKINNLEKENALHALEVQKGNQRKLIWIGSALILALGLLTLMYILRRKSRTNALLEEKNTTITKSLQDKDILLREIHHRVKNNLQVVSSLLNLQSNFISDNAALEAITEGKNRVSSMALIHQNLYQENNLTSINSKEYFDDLIYNLFDSYNIDEANIKLKKNIHDLDIDVDTMIPLGLIVNELVSNSLKHAFGNSQKKGEISVDLIEENDELVLTISDNGIGMTEDHFLNSQSFGNKMIKAFRQKLNAEIKITNQNGTTVSIQIKNYKLNAA